MGCLKLTPLNHAFLNKPISHRGLHDHSRGIIENSSSAFAASIAAGLPIECDLQSSSDGLAVVFHDAYLSRLTNLDGDTKSLTSVELNATQLKDSDDLIQTFEQLLQQVGGAVPLLVEIKDQSGELGPTPTEFIKHIAKCANSYQGVIALMSFNPFLIEALHKIAPNLCIGLVTDDFASDDWPDVPKKRAHLLNNLDAVSGLDIAFISHNRTDLARVANLDLPKLCWTVKSEAEETAARAIADNITFEGYMPAIK